MVKYDFSCLACVLLLLLCLLLSLLLMFILLIMRGQIPYTGNTRPSRTCVIQEYRFHTMSLCQYHWCCLFHDSMSLPWVHVYTMITCLYHDSMSLPWDPVYSMSSCLYYESMSIPQVNVYAMIPCLYHESMSIPWVLVNSKRYLKVQVVPKVQEVPKGPRGT